jgi:CubicO group peptidase (beta-lactamase class C family)
MQRRIALTILGLVSQGICLFATAQTPAQEIDKLMSEAARQDLFSGVIAVVEKGTTIYSKGFGLTDSVSGKAIDENTLFNLCSITKQFTAMAVIQLKEQRKLNYTDDVRKYFPQLPYTGVTIHHLLTHTSGLPDYMMLAIQNWTAGNQNSNKEAIALLEKFKPPVLFAAGDRFQYSNTGYMLLAVIIEKVSGMSFAAFLKQQIFEPLKMQRSFVCTPIDNDKGKTNITTGYVFDRRVATNVAAGQSEQFARQVNTIMYPVGDGGVYSSAADMMKWNLALSSEKLAKRSSLREAFTSAKTNDGQQTGYGFGWFVVNDSTQGQVVQHTGGWPGYRNAFIKILDKDRAILVLRNSEIEFRGIQPAITSILDGRPFLKPKSSLGQLLALAAPKGDASTIHELYEKAKSSSVADEAEINDVGYGLMEKGLIVHALEVMKINAVLFPSSWNVFDSLGEMYLKNGDKANARLNYQKSLTLNPENDGAKKALANL